MPSEADLEALHAFITEPPPSDFPQHVPESRGWQPELNPVEELVFNDPSPTVLIDSEKGSGKSHVALEKLVRHCYEAGDARKIEPITALAIIIVTSYNTGDIGIWYELENRVLPQWRDGNRYPAWCKNEVGQWVPHPRAHELMDEGIGLEYTATKLDPKTKSSKIYIANRFGTASLVVLMSIPSPLMIEARMKGMAPSFILLEEMTNCASRKYYSFTSAQLNRRPGTGNTPHQFVATMNPAGPTHWAYKLIFEECKVEPNEPGKDWPDGIRRRPSVARFHIPLEENIQHVGMEYIRRLQDAFAGDAVELQRLLEGIWVDRPTGIALFRDEWGTIHIRGDLRKTLGIVPNPLFSVLVGYDPGPVNFCVSFEQLFPAKEKLGLSIFDELNSVGKCQPYFVIVPAIMRRMWFWCKSLDYAFIFEHIADEAAFNQRDKHGKFDYQEIEALSRKWCLEHPEAKLQPIKLRPCPKGDDSVPARARMMKAFMQREALRVSALCVKTCEMFAMLESEDAKDGKYDPDVAFRPKRSIYIHPFDAVSYPPFYYAARGRVGPRTAQVDRRVYEAGTR